MLCIEENQHLLETPNLNTGVPKAIDHIMRASQELTGVPPLLNLSAPNSIAADIYGQETPLADAVNDPDNVTALLNHLGDKVLGPWMDLACSLSSYRTKADLGPKLSKSYFNSML